jgi:TonB family protein
LQENNFNLKGFGDKIHQSLLFYKQIMNKFFLSTLFVLSLCSFISGQDTTQPIPGSGIGTGKGNGDTNETSKPAVSTSDKTIWTRLLSKPPAKYTDTARKNGLEGTVRLRVVFLASGEIGSILPVSFLSDGLTEQAIAAARSIKFEPATRNGIPVSTTKVVEYSFSIYYRENDEALERNAEILEKPAPLHPQESDLQSISGKVKVRIALKSNGEIQIIQTNTNLPKEFVQKVSEAIAKIKFKPAIHKNGNAVTQDKEIEYEFSKQKN